MAHHWNTKSDSRIVFISAYLFSLSCFSLSLLFFPLSNPARPVSSTFPSPRWTTHEPQSRAIFLSSSVHLLCYRPPLDGYLTPSAMVISVFQPVTLTRVNKELCRPRDERWSPGVGWLAAMRYFILLRVKEANVTMVALSEMPERSLNICFFYDR